MKTIVLIFLSTVISAFVANAQDCSQKLQIVSDFIGNAENLHNYIDSTRFDKMRKRRFHRIVKKSILHDTLRYQVYIPLLADTSVDSSLFHTAIGKCFVNGGLPHAQGVPLAFFMNIIDENTISFKTCENPNAPDFGLFYEFTFVFKKTGGYSISFRHGSQF